MRLKDITNTLKIGVVGYSETKFNPKQAKKLVKDGIDELVKRHKPTHVDIVSGHTNLGIPAIAYEYALEKKYQTTGVSCKEANEYEVFPVDTIINVGDDFGDESETFLRHIDCLLRVGGGEQSLDETKAFKKLKPDAIVIEYELEEKDG